MKNIVLIGMMGCGKSTVGKLLARRLGRDLIDTDILIEEQEGCSIPQMFAEKGEGYFRDKEVELSRMLAQGEDLIIACGGGLPLRKACIEPLKETGIVFFLNRDVGQIYDTVSMVNRPLGQVSREEFLARFAQREPIYRNCAHYEVTGVTRVEEAINAILEVLR